MSVPADESTMRPNEARDPYRYGDRRPPSQPQEPAQSGPPPAQPGPEWSGPPPAQQWHQPPPPPQAASPPPQAQPAPSPQAAPTQTTQPGQPPGPVGQGPPTPARPAGRGRPLLRPVRLEEIGETDVVTVEPETPLPTVVATMAERDVGSVVVVEDERPVGLVTDRSVALALESMPNLADHVAEDLISDDIVTGTPDTSIFDAIRLLEDAEVRRLPIVDEEETLAGIVTLDDIVVLLAEELGNVSSVIKAQSPRL